jgi:hypothetical protein
MLPCRRRFLANRQSFPKSSPPITDYIGYRVTRRITNYSDVPRGGNSPESIASITRTVFFS